MLNDCKTSCIPCGLHQPRRNSYFDGKLLVARDFSDEQDYHRGHRQMHNALLHGTGTVCGLKLIEHPSETCRRDFVVVEPGLALDCCGQEIVVPKSALVRVADLVRADPDLQAALDGTAHLFIAIERCDAGAERMPVILPGCAAEEGGAFGRIAEGYRFALFAAQPRDVTPVRVAQNPRLDWVHTFSYEGGVPKAVHVNEGEALVQIATQDGIGARLLGYDRDTHDLDALVGGSKTVSDTASSREARLVFVAGSGFSGTVANGIGIWRAAGLGGTAEPDRVIPIKGAAARIAVSPSSGTLYVLELDGTANRLVSYSQAVIDAYLADGDASVLDGQPDLTFDHGFGAAGDAPGRGASMMEITRDGRFLALSSPVGAAKDRLYLIDTSKFREGGMTQGDALAKGYAPEAAERIDLVKWSFDDGYLYVVSREAASSQTILLTRYLLIDGEARLEKAGRGVKLIGTAYDIALAPTETRAYLLMADAEGVTRFTTVGLDAVKSQDAGPPPETGLSPDAFRIDGLGRSLALAGNGTRLYLAAAAGEETMPPHGLVAVIDIAEEDCGIHFREAVQGCDGCGTDPHRVVLGHVAGYVWPGEDRDLPRIRDPERAGADDLALDNFAFRPIVPSASTLKEVIECILAQGVAEGPPGPRGDPGARGEDGLSGEDGKVVTQVTVATLNPNQPATATVADNGPGLTLNLGIPRGTAGQPGQPGAPGTGLAPGNPIVALSWQHAGPHWARDLGKFESVFREQGIAIAFEKPVVWKDFTGSEKAGRSMLIELELPLIFGHGLVQWITAQVWAHPIDNPVINGDILESWDILDAADLTPGVCLRADERFHLDLNLDLELGFRVLLYGDFVMTEDGVAVDGNFLGGKLPTGASGGGNTFRSWFTLERG